MTSECADRISVVLPTFNRSEALKGALSNVAELDDVAEIVVVDDGSTDGTSQLLASLDDRRIRCCRHPVRRGQPAARNSGVDATRGAYVLFCEDDCRFPADYGTTLREALEEASAHVAGAPWVNPGRDTEEETVRRLRANPVSHLSLSSHPSSFPSHPVITPFLPAPVLVKRDVFDHVRFDEGYRGNAYREETSFFVEVMERGMRCVLTPETYSVQAGQWTGGARASAVRYELWLLRNNWRFLKKHASWLRSNDAIRSVPSAQARLFLTREPAQLAKHARRAVGRLVRVVGPT